MNCPTINDYLATVSNHHGLFRSLDITPHRNKYGEVVFISGNHSAVFKADTPKGCVALKCYTRNVEDLQARYDFINRLNTPYTQSYSYLPEEVFVYQNDLQGRFFPVLTTPWIEGATLIRHIRKLCYQHNTGALRSLTASFDRMALWLLDQEFAHGDLKHDNILIDNNGELHLIDFDGAFIPDMPDLKNTTVGSPAFQHPHRQHTNSNRHIDDYPIAVISLSLHALCYDPSLLDKYHDTENIIFNASELHDNHCEAINYIRQLWFENGETALLALSNLLQGNDIRIEGLHDIISCINGNHKLTADNTYETIDHDVNYTLIRKSGLYGYANTNTSEIIIHPVYEEAQLFSEDLATVKFNDKWYYVDRHGKCAIDCCLYNNIEPFREGMAKITDNDRAGFINRNGEEVIPAIYEAASGFRNGISHVKSEGVWFSIDKHNQRVSDQNFTTIDDLKKSTV